jgi:hypothetical protein
MLYTTLNNIREFSPREDGWKQLLAYLNKTKADDESLDFKTIIEAVGIKDAIWYLRTQEFKDYYTFVTRVAHSVLPIFESKHPNDMRPRLAIEAVEKFINGKISKEELGTTRAAAHAAADAAYWAAAAADAAAWAAAAADAADAAAADAARAAVSDADACAVSDAAAWAANAAATAAYAAARAAAADAADAWTAREKKWKEIEQIFIEECLN